MADTNENVYVITVHIKNTWEFSNAHVHLKK